jgi:hypothetical protein
MNYRIWRTSALAASITLVVLLSTQGAAGQPPASAATLVPQASVLLNTNGVASQPAATPVAIPESASLLLLGATFAFAARQLRRVI